MLKREEVRDKAASIGTIVHYLIGCSIRDIKPDISKFKPNDVKKAMLAFKTFKSWRMVHRLKIPGTGHKPRVYKISKGDV